MDTDLINRVLRLLAEAEMVGTAEIRKVSSEYTTTPSGTYLGGMSRSGQQIRALAARKHGEAQEIALAQVRSFTTDDLQEHMRQLALDSELLEVLSNLDIVSRFGNDPDYTYEIARGFEIWVRPNDDEDTGVADDDDELDEDFPGLLASRGSKD